MRRHRVSPVHRAHHPRTRLFPGVTRAVAAVAGIVALATPTATGAATPLATLAPLGATASFAVVNNHLWVATARGVEAVSLTTHRLLTKVDIAGLRGGGAMANDGTHLWLTSSLGNGVAEVSNTSGALERFVSAASADLSGASLISATSRYVWIEGHHQALVQMDARSGSLVRVIGRLRAPWGAMNGLFAVGPDAVIVSAVAQQPTPGPATVTVVSGLSGQIVRRFTVSVAGFSAPQVSTYADGRLFLVDRTTGATVAVNPANGAARLVYTPTPALTPMSEQTLYVAGSQMWLAQNLNSRYQLPRILHVDLTTQRRTGVIADVSNRVRNPEAVTVAAGLLWVANGGYNTLNAFSPTTGAIVVSLPNGQDL